MTPSDDDNEDQGIVSETAEMLIDQLKFSLAKINDKRPKVAEEMLGTLEAISSGKMKRPDREYLLETLKELITELGRSKPDRARVEELVGDINHRSRRNTITLDFFDEWGIY